MRKRGEIAAVGILHRARQFFGEWSVEDTTARSFLGRVRAAGQFIYLIVRGFTANRCAVRAAALSYTTLLALVPVMAVVFILTKSFLQATSAELVPKILDKIVTVVAPQLQYMSLPDDVAGPPAPGQSIVPPNARLEVTQKIQSFIENIDAGTLGTVATVLLVFVGIRLFMTIEQAFNDIWGVHKGRTIWRKITYYWTTITLGPLLLLLAFYLTGKAEFSTLITRFGIGAQYGKFLYHIGAYVVLWLGFALMYALVPNTRVRPHAALIGGIVGGTLWQLNSMLSALYLSKVVTYSKIYGTMGIIPVLLVGLYFSWLIVLFGAQVSFATQTIRTYRQQRAAETIDQSGRELIACRVVLRACQSFIRGLPLPTQEELAEELRAPLHLVNQIVERLVEGGMLSEVGEDRGGLLPARLPEQLTVADVLHVMRTRQGTGTDTVPTDGADAVLGLLQGLRAAERVAPGNLRFSELANRLNSAIS